MILTDTTTLEQSERGKNENKWVLDTPQITRTGVLSDAV